ncbi:MAG TPA: glycine/sarcosine/betaine reductase component B subunit, partial [Candidatus Limiplasma sp.]|nr:glycine/sarcosine/betaine reductase component B subunit [Candidatus Limiplasma sp.]
MSISADTLRQHLQDPAVFCCRRQKGTVIGPGDLEDPSLFEEMLASGLIALDPRGLTIGQSLGKTLAADCEALTAIVPAMLTDAPAPEAPPQPAAPASGAIPAPTMPAPGMAPTPAMPAFAAASPLGMIHLEIGRLENVKIDFPIGAFPFPGSMPPPPPPIPQAPPVMPAELPAQDQVKRVLTKKYFTVREVALGDRTAFENGVLTLDRALAAEARKASPLVKELTIDVIRPDQRHLYTQTIMDICPVSTKVQGMLGEGVSHVLDGMVFMLTGMDEAGVQVHEFGSSEGY